MTMLQQQPYEETDRLLDTREAARLLGVSARTVSSLMKRGTLERIKIGRATRVRLSDVERIIRRGGVIE